MCERQQNSWPPNETDSLEYLTRILHIRNIGLASSYADKREYLGPGTVRRKDDSSDAFETCLSPGTHTTAA
jgi:hypothetical protein